MLITDAMRNGSTGDAVMNMWLVKNMKNNLWYGAWRW
jgi:hypothetical protein